MKNMCSLAFAIFKMKIGIRGGLDRKDRFIRLQTIIQRQKKILSETS